ncbi:MAG TPA: SpoIIE family protein phosphatase [Actinomycetota bacterium]|nr:SpoIIE family protein phosphatase [Actinomycetota bacterium]
MTNPSAPPSVTFRTVRRRLIASPEAASLARRAIDELGTDALSPLFLDDLRLLVSEVVTNAVRHAASSPDDVIELTARSGNGRVWVEVTDPGAGFRYDGPSGTLDAEGGWGLYLVDRIADRWGIDDDPSTRVWFEILDRPMSVARVDEATLLDAIGAAVIATDPDGIITHWNQGAETLYGYPRNETIGRSMADFLVEPHDAGAAARILDRMRSGEAWSGEWSAPRRDGSRVEIVFSNAPVRDARGRLMGVVGISIDVADRRRAEDELRRSEERLRVALEAGAMGTWEWSVREGTVRWSEALELIHGLEPGGFGGTFEDYQRDMHPDDRDRVLSAIRRAVDAGDDYEVHYRIVRPDGEERWLAARARVIRDHDGAAERLVGVCTDVTERTHAERLLIAEHAIATALAQASTLEEITPAVLEALGTSLGWDVGAVHVVEDDDRLRCVGTWLRAGHAAAEFVEATERIAFARGEGLPGRVWEAGEPLWIDDFAAAPGLPRGEIAARASLHAAIGFPMRVGDSVLGVVELFGHEVRPPDEAVLSLLRSVGRQIGLVVARRRAEAERADLLERERVARAAAEKANERLAFLASAGMTFASSLDAERTLRDLARMCVPRVADWCAIEIAGDDGVGQQIEVAHADPAKLALAAEYRRRYPPDADARTGVPNVLRTGQPELYPEITDEMLDAGIRDAEQRSMLGALGLRSAMIVPLVARNRVLGAITFAAGDESGRRFDEHDLAFVGHLARRAALSLDNARLYRERATIASTLQRSLLPPTLPDVPHVDVAAVYQAAAIERNDVGGDFYDVFELSGDTWAATIGDVCGKGVEAAALTGLLRHTLRAETLHARAPAKVLRNLNTGLMRHGTDRFCTVALAFLRPTPTGVHVTVGCAGHPLPFVLRRDGTVQTLGEIGTVLGVLDEISVHDRDAELVPGDALVLFTDGLLDPRRSDPVDEDGLSLRLAGYAGRDARAIAEGLARSVGDPATAPDDVAIVVLRVRDA